MTHPPAGQSSPPHGTPLAPEDPTLSALRGALAGHYEVERLLGQGGMGSVYLGRDVTLDRRVAIKVISSELAASTALRERFLREARTVARLRHPNIVAVHAAGEADGLLYFVMEFVPGESLRDRLARGAYDDASAVAALRDLARALGYAHAQGVVHRDVKPENVLLDAETGRAMLTDFGVARAFDARGQDERMTGTGFVVGSPRYMSPEQAAGERELDGRSDTYSLGLVGYEMFAGEPAVAGGSAASIIMRQITERPAPLTTRNTHVNAAVASVVERALEKQPEARWATATDMGDALDAALRGEGGPAPQARTTSLPGAAPSAPAAGRRRLLAIGALGVVAVAAAAGVAVKALGGGAPRGVDPRKSYVVAPFDVLSPDPQLAWLREGAVSMLSLDLAQWRDLQVVDYERGLDLLRDLKLDGARRIGQEDAIRLARKAGVWTVVTGRVTLLGDTTLVVANVYDVASAKKIDSAMRSMRRGADPRPLFDALARDLLDLAGAPPVALGLAQSTTSSVEAYRDYLEGARAMNAWQLARADSLFAAATAVDSTFALAYYKRALNIGWWKAGDAMQRPLVAQAVQNAGRLPPRERALLDAYDAFSSAMYGPEASDSVRNARFVDAQRKYAAAVARDSGDAEAWYGLGDAYYHHMTGNWSDSTTRDHWTRALAAFNRTLALDSTFHLAYSHKVGIYQQAAGPNTPLVLDGEVLRSTTDPATRAAFQGARLAAAKERARQLAVREARMWAAADPVPQAFFGVAQAYLPAFWDSAAMATDEGVRRLGVRGAGTLAFARPFILTRTDQPRAVATVHEALQANDSASLAAAGGSDRFVMLMGAMQVAAMGGRLSDVDAAGRLAAAVQPKLNGSPTPTSVMTQWYGAATRLAAGVPPASLRPTIDGGLAGLERIPGRFGDGARRQSMMVPYVAMAALRDRKYAAMVQRWRGADTTVWPEVEAFDALLAGDTARARAAAQRFPSPDSVRAATSGINAPRWVVRAEVLAALGDTRRALAMYEVIDPKRFPDLSIFDPSPVLWARSYLARGRLYEQLGQRAEAAAAYERFATLWKDADSALQPQLREAQAGLARVRDARAGQPVGR
jgi:serine/threonine-protein kinase